MNLPVHMAARVGCRPVTRPMLRVERIRGNACVPRLVVVALRDGMPSDHSHRRTLRPHLAFLIHLPQLAAVHVQHAPIRRRSGLREALSEGHQQPERALQPNLPPQQRPHHALFLIQKADPRLRVGGDM